MELLISKKFKLPDLMFLSDRSKIQELSPGVPFIYGDEESKEYIIRMLEFELLYQKALSTGLPFDFRKILKDNGYNDLESLYYSNPVYMDYVTEKIINEDFDIDSEKTVLKDNKLFKKFVKDNAAYVDIQKLKNLNVFPIWLDKIEQAVFTNIHNFAVFNANMYNKKLDGMYGSLELTSPGKNLIIIDISGSIPKAVSSTCLVLAKNLAETFYADLLITGSKSTLYFYEELYKLNIQTIYDENDMDNDQLYFKKLVSEHKCYKTAIVFGDNDHPGYNWNNRFNKKTNYISDEDGKKLCKWEIDKLISFHTSSVKSIAGYARWFTPKEIEKIADWVKYLD